MSIFSNNKTGIVNVRMVITEEKIKSNIDKVQRMINPNSKKQIVELEEDTYFKDLIESIKTYLVEYPKKKNFPASVYNAAYGLVEYATNQFEENTKEIEKLIRQREFNISLSGELKQVLQITLNKEKKWKDAVKQYRGKVGDDVIQALVILGRCRDELDPDYQAALKLVNARISNLESNLHIEIDIERIEDRSKALSFIGIEIADALKGIPAPIEETLEEQVGVQEMVSEAMQQYEADTFEAKPTLWQKIKNSKVGKAIKMIMSIRIVVDNSNALPAGTLTEGENKEQQ